MITYHYDDCFANPAPLMVNTVNCVGVMGAGIAKTFKAKYPSMFDDYVRRCHEKKVIPGTPYTWTDGTTTIVNFPTKNHWQQPSQYDWIEKGLVWLKDYLDSLRNPPTINIPPLGCGHGKLRWQRVRTLIEHYLGEYTGHIAVYHPTHWPNVKGHIAGVGSRDTPDDVLGLMTQLGEVLAQRGWCLRSGGAIGADRAFEAGWYNVRGHDPGFSEIYVVNPQSVTPDKPHYYLGHAFPTWSKAQAIVSQIHPAWATMENKIQQGIQVDNYRYSMALHTRNVYQVLGPCLNQPVKALYCWAPTRGNHVTGGTRTAVELAKQYQIPVINLVETNARQSVEHFIQKHSLKG